MTRKPARAPPLDPRPLDRVPVPSQRGGTITDSGSPREEAIIELLRLYRDLEGVSVSGGGGGRGSDDRMLYNGGKRTLDGGWLWDAEWDKTGCDAIDSLLAELREERPVQWWHTTERYVRCEVRPRRVKLERTNSGRLRTPPPGAHTAYLGEAIRQSESWLSASEAVIVVEVWSPQVRLEKARRGVSFLSQRFPWDKFRWTDLTQVAA